MSDDEAAKLTRLIEELRLIGVDAKRSAKRVVVFSERIATLDWLAEKLPAALGLDPVEQVRVLHGGMSDVSQMDIIEEFGLEGSKVRLLLTGDMASEGVNLHRQCHHLVHFDLPWSLITIEQRNGRIDRFGQKQPPEIRAMILEPDHPRCSGDVRVITRLLEREDNAHRGLGDSASLLGLGTVELEEQAISRALRDGIDEAEVVPAQPAREFDWWVLGDQGATGSQPAPVSELPTLFESDHRFVLDGLDAAFEGRKGELELQFQADVDPTYFELTPPDDLKRRFGALPREYMREQKLNERLRLTADPEIATNELQAAFDSAKSSWPEVGYLSPLHPIVDWIGDKVLSAVGRNQAPVIVADVDRPTFCVLGMYGNGRGQPQLVEWMAVSFDDAGGAEVHDLFEVLGPAGVGPTMVNPGRVGMFEAAQAAVPNVVEAARLMLEQRKDEHEQELEERLAAPIERLEAWTTRRHQLALNLDNRTRRSAEDRVTGAVGRDTTVLIDSLRISGRPLVRVLAVLVGDEVAS